jgi:quinol monooxygenase YgiN
VKNSEKNSSTEGVVTLIAEIKSLVGHEAQVASLLSGYTTQVRAEVGNRFFAASSSQADPTIFLVYEEYRDAAAFQAHLNAPANAVFNGALAEHVSEGGSVLTMLDVLPGF